jgi:hypothetical protein
VDTNPGTAVKKGKAKMNLKENGGKRLALRAMLSFPESSSDHCGEERTVAET